MMKLTRKGRWGLLLPHLRNPYYSELVEALSREARFRKTTLLLSLSLGDEDARDVVEQWTAGETDGIILDQSYYRQSPEYFEMLRKRGIAMVFLHGRPIPGFDFVHYQLHENSLRNVRHLGALGHLRIAFVGQEFAGCNETGRYRAFADYHKETGHEIDEKLVVFGDDGYLGGRSAWQRLSRLKKPPTAVVCADDIIACGVMHAAHAQGLRIPRDLSVTGVDDIAEAERGALTTIHTSREDAAKAMLELLENRLADRSLPPQIAAIPSVLILRDSVGAPRAEKA
jgi:LacI family transcriptional regulator